MVYNQPKQSAKFLGVALKMEKDWKIVRRGKISITYKNKKLEILLKYITFLKLKSY